MSSRRVDAYVLRPLDANASCQAPMLPQTPSSSPRSAAPVPPATSTSALGSSTGLSRTAGAEPGVATDIASAGPPETAALGSPRLASSGRAASGAGVGSGGSLLSGSAAGDGGAGTDSAAAEAHGIEGEDRADAEGKQGDATSEADGSEGDCGGKPPEPPRSAAPVPPATSTSALG
eukprot:CAMPEP_0183516760 /NCGR_PEP_ID=MMETSP0371-20130417/14433_1 /TAXON_ID=268820 /ORGANISM="Peridinium aciculiferum, Strain PAER-2" /LENGTH=175 /DNA_ID=CAMNT_0025714553 /DNA_START=23 /DNA_END=546 /DNA_ORIENTATION=-